MNITLNKQEMAILEKMAIEKAAYKAAKAENMTMPQFLNLNKCTAISYYNGLFTVEFGRVSRRDDSLLSGTAKALPLHLRLEGGNK